MNFPGNWEVNKISIERSCVSRPADDRTGRLVLLSTISCLSWYESSYVISQFEIIILFLELSWLTSKKFFFYLNYIFISDSKFSENQKHLPFLYQEIQLLKNRRLFYKTQSPWPLKTVKVWQGARRSSLQDSTPLVA